MKMMPTKLPDERLYQVRDERGLNIESPTKGN